MKLRHVLIIFHFKLSQVAYNQVNVIKSLLRVLFVVGGGTAGSVLANRLSVAPNVRVLLLEAGGDDENVVTDIPLFARHLQQTDVDWKFKTVPQKYACMASQNSVNYTN